MRRRTLGALAAAAMALVALTACSSSTDQAEDMMNDALSGSASVDIDDDGGIKVEASDGTFAMGTGELPSDWPAEVPAPPGFDVVLAGSNDGAFNASFQAQGNQMAAVDDYVKLLMNSGFAVDGQIPLGANGMYGLVGFGYKVDMLAIEMGSGTQLTMRIEPID